MSEHEPLPWMVVPDSHRVTEGEGYAVADAGGMYYLAWGASKANAEYIVLACNLFPELVAMLEKHAFTELDCPECCCMLADDRSGHENGCRLGNVLAKARGEQP